MDDVRRLDSADQDLLLCVEDDVVATTTAGDGAWADDLEERAANLGEPGQFGLIKPHSNEIELKMMVHAKDSDEIFVDSTSSDSKSSENDDVISDSEDSKTSCDEISKEELLRSLKLKLNKKKVSVDCNLKRKRSETAEVDFKNQLDSALLEIFRDNVLIGTKRKLYCHKSKVNYLDFLNFGMRKVLQDTPRIKVWKGTMIKKFSKFDKISKGVYGKRPIKDFSESCYKMIETGTAKATFLQRLDFAIGVDLPQEIKKDINELLLHHLGPDENCINDRVKNLLIDIFDLLSNASKPSVPDNTDFNPSEDDKNKLNDGSIINEANICETPKIHSTCDDNAILNEQSPMLCKDTKTPERSCSEKDKNSDVDGIMRKLCKPGMISSPPKITKARFVGFNERKPIYFDHEKPQFQIWDSDDDNINQEDNLRSEVTPRHGLKSSKIVPDSYSPTCPTELNKTKIIPLDLSQNLYDLSQNQENNSENEDQLIMVTLEDSETQSQHKKRKICLFNNSTLRQQKTKSFFFPIVKNRHWFVFAIDLKAQRFDCGIFTLKFMETFTNYWMITFEGVLKI
ncbi:hypothetical protein OsI_18253 [Oryza sativa Indica Group]|uniref:Ubiquitin-like protease family profile domain-containing protein n=1 Tax=Oryza sativa subsp. indica TaxID=39946 RepID=B8AXD0_ORYSI|nr:hypothetical protein OsI_18253 [Oryza sativa Indica Group]